MRSFRTRTILARLCVPFVSMPAWRPVKLMAGYPIASSASASSVMDTCSPVDSRRSSSRAGGSALTALASPMSSSVVLPMADTTATTWLPASCMAARRRATPLIRSGEATEVPPNFATINDIESAVILF